MQFHVGPFAYRLVISDRSVYDDEGNELEGCAVERRRLLILSRIVEPDRREEVAMHEFTHAFGFHFPEPRNEEERCQLTALICRQFHDDLERQGGREAMRQLPAERVPHLGRPRPARAPSEPEVGRSDRRVCGACGAEVMPGSIRNSEVENHGPTSRMRMTRWMECDCGVLQTWLEYCTSDGEALGIYVSNPPPRMLYGAEAARWLAERNAMAGA